MRREKRKSDNRDRELELNNEQRARLEAFLEQIEPFMDDLLHRGSVQPKFSDRPEGPQVLMFRQRETGAADGRQRRLYIGPKSLADALWDEIIRRRRQARTWHFRGPPVDPEEHRSVTEFLRPRRPDDPTWQPPAEFAILEELLQQLDLPPRMQADTEPAPTGMAAPAVMR
jgi:hypothetical protein